MMINHLSPSIARDQLTAMTTRPYASTDPYRPTDIYDRRSETLRELLTDETFDDYASDRTPDDPILPRHEFEYMRELLAIIRAAAAEQYDETNRQFLSMLALDHSLCPMHMIDYAICFDDADPDCSQIRAYFPAHDT